MRDARRVFLTAAIVASAGIACRHEIATAPSAPPPLHCLGSAPGPVEWIRGPHDARLDQWCAQVGSPLVVHAPVEPAAAVRRLVVVSWNVHVGGGRVLELVEWLRRRAAADGEPVGFVLLLQEAYRAGGDIQAPLAGGGIPGAIRPVRPALDVEALGRYLRMSVAYIPSMRNGDRQPPEDREDRGSAVLSSEPISDVSAIELPFGRQRRVAALATVTPRGSAPLRVIAAHLDTFRDTNGQRRQAASLAEHIKAFRQTSAVPLLIGADTNALRGLHDETVQTLARAAPIVERCSKGPSTGFRLRVDFLFSTLDPSKTQGCRTLDGEFGSDHRPLVLTFDPPPDPSR